MKVVLVNPTFYSSNSIGLSYGEPLGLAYIAASIEETGLHDVQVIDSVGLAGSFPKVAGEIRFGLDENILLRKILDSRPDVICITLSGTLYSTYYYDLIGELKKATPRTPIIVGGPHATLEHEECMEHPIDVLVMGEGEKTINEVLLAIEENRGLSDINGILYKAEGSDEIVRTTDRPPVEIDKIPLPARHLFPMENYFKYRPTHFYRNKPIATILTSRACPFDCLFCSTTLVWGKKYRVRNAKLVVDEMELLINKYGVKEFLFNDDCFLGKRSHVIELCDEIIKRNLNITYQVPAGMNFNLLNSELLKKMKQSGLYAIRPQLETGNPKTAKYIRKIIDFGKAKNIISEANRLGLWTQTNIILGFADETVEDIKLSIENAESIGFDSINYIIPIVHKETDLALDYVEKGLLKPNFKKSTSVDSLHLSIKELQIIQKKAQRMSKVNRLKKLANPLYFYFEFLPKINSRQKLFFLLRRIFGGIKYKFLSIG
jgi:anaerobic magnesium-protoporphyrin IX monomethyl ester cyclase